MLTLSKKKVGSLDFDLAGKNQFNTGDVADCLQSSADQRRAGQHRETSRYTFPFFSMKKKSTLSQEKRVGTLSRISPFTFAFYESSNVINAK